MLTLNFNRNLTFQGGGGFVFEDEAGQLWEQASLLTPDGSSTWRLLLSPLGGTGDDPLTVTFPDGYWTIDPGTDPMPGVDLFPVTVP